MKPEENISLSEHTTFKIGGPARYFFRVKDIDELREALEFARQNQLPFFVLGGGSNLLISDKGYSGVIIKNEFFGLTFSDTGGHIEARVAAGENWDGFVSEVVSRGFHGLENLSGIPGTVGAVPVQNIGAYGSEVKDTILQVEVFDTVNRVVKIISVPECRFSYRDSFFKTKEGKKFIITAVTFRLRRNVPFNIEYKDLKNYFAQKNISPTLPLVRKAVLEIRKGKFPDLKTTGTAGSFFKNPIIPRNQFDELKKKFPALPGFPLQTTNYKLQTSVKIPLAWILDNILKLKGFQKGAIGLYTAQPLVIINVSDGSAVEVLQIAEEISGRVKDLTGIDINFEVEYLN